MTFSRSRLTIAARLTIMRTVDRKLAAHPFVFGMSHQDVGLLSDCAMMADFSKGEIIFHQGAVADRVFLVEEGAVALESLFDSKPIVTETVRDGELLGLSWLFPPHKWRVTARACEPTIAIAINGALLRKYAERDDTLSLHLHKRFTEVMTRRFQSMRERFIDLIRGSGQTPGCE